MTSATPAATASRRRRNLLIVATIVVVVLVVGGAYGLWYLFLRPSGPAAVSGEGLIAVPTASSVPLPAGGSDGTWNVDTSIGSFADSTASFVGYRVQEQLASIGANTAVGRTPNVTGSLTVSGTKVTAVSITADLTALQSDDQRRDGQLVRRNPNRHLSDGHLQPDLADRPGQHPGRRPRDRCHRHRQPDPPWGHQVDPDRAEGAPVGLDHRGGRVNPDRVQRLPDPETQLVRGPVDRGPGHP